MWQSFDYPCDNFLPGMKLGRNLVTGFERYISSWKSIDDPAQGEYSKDRSTWTSTNSGQEGITNNI